MTTFFVKWQFKPALLITAAIVLIQLANFLSSGQLSGWGIVPRQLSGLAAIPFAPFIHHSWGHLASNLIPLFILMTMVLQLGKKVFWLSSIGIILISGIGVWLMASRGVHAGSSSLIFGYWSFLLVYGWLYKSLKSLLLALVVLLLYGGMFWSLFSFQPNISWSSHAFGALSGILMAWILNRNKR